MIIVNSKEKGRILAVIGLFAFLISAFLPWITVTLHMPFPIVMPKSDLNLFEIYVNVLGGGRSLFFVGEVTTSLVFYMFLMFMALILYPVTGIISLVSIAMATSKAYISTGILAIATGLLWAVGLELMKSYMISQFPMLTSFPVSAGIGTYLTVMAGFIFIIAGMFKPETEIGF
jgi:hypothetical protein